MPLLFEPNEGQSSDDVLFLTRAAGAKVGLRRDGLTLRPTAPGDSQIELTFTGKLGSDEPAGEQAANTRVNYLSRARSLRDIPTYSRVRYSELYPGMDLVAHGAGQEFEFDLLVKPGADLGRFGMDVSAANAASGASTNPSIDEEGDLRLSRGLALRAPQAWQQGSDGQRHAVAVHYAAQGKHIMLVAGAYDHTRPLTIDPQLVMTYGTYLSGSNGSTIYGVAADSSGDTYVAGIDTSTDFPTKNALETTGSYFISKLNSAGTALVYSTYIAGTTAGPQITNSGDQVPSGHTLAVDSSGNAYLVGIVQASDTFPLTASAYPLPASPNNYNYSFLLKLSADGSQIPYATYTTNYGFGFSPISVAVDNAGKAYISGGGQYGTAPTTSNGYMPTVPSSEVQAAFLEKFDTTQSGTASLPYSTYFGYNGVNSSDVACDNAGHAFLIGQTLLVNTGHGGNAPGTIPTRNAIQSTPPGNADAFLAKFDTTASGDASLLASTYIGGTGNDYATSMALDASNNVYITGTTTSGDFLANPTSNGTPAQSYLLSSQDGFAVKIAASGSALTLVYSTYIGNTATTSPNGISAMTNGQAVVSGYASSGLVTLNGLTVATPSGTNYDNFIAELSPTGQSYVYSSYLGNTTGQPKGSFVALQGELAVVAGTWTNTATPLPTTAGAIQTSAPANGSGGFIAKYVFQTGTAPYISNVTPNTGSNVSAVSFTISGGGLQSGATVTLNAGSGTVTAQDVQVSADGGTLTGNFDLRGVSTGAADLVVTNPDATTATLTQGFTVQASSTDGTFTQVIGPSSQRIGGGMVYTILYGNNGNTDQFGVPLFVTFNNTFGYKILSPLIIPDDSTAGGHLDFSLDTSPGYDDGNGNTVLEFFVPWIPAGTTSAIRLLLTAPASQSYILAPYDIYSQMFPETFMVGPVGSSTGSLRGTAGQVQIAALSGAPQPFGNKAELPAFLRDLIPTAAGERLLGALAAAKSKPEPEIPVVFGQSGSTAPGWVNNLVYTPGGKACISNIAQTSIDFISDGVGLIPGVGCVSGSIVGKVADQVKTQIGNQLGQPASPAADLATDLATYGLDAANCIPVAGQTINIVKGVKNIIFLVYYTGDCYSTAITGQGLGANGAGALAAGLAHLRGILYGSYDPNLKSGPQGFGAPNWIGSAEPLNYSIEFQNQPTATAAAQNVLIVDVLDTNTIDLSTFAFGPVVIGTHMYTPPANSSSINTTMDLRPDVNVLVQVQASLDTAGSDLVWQFASLDPGTGQPLPTGSVLGFLPADMPVPLGEGNVSFTAKLKSGVTTGTVLNNGASVTFDSNSPIYTPTWSNTIDVDAPASSVTALPATSGPNIPVAWSGSDIGSGIVSYSIYVSQNGGAFAPWLTNTTFASANYPGVAGNTYSFFSMARDGAGNFEPLKSTGDTSTMVPAGSAPIVSLNASSLNFASQTVTTSSAAQTLTIMNTGGAPLAISSIQISGGAAAGFTGSNGCGTSLAANASCNFPIIFTPSAAGSASAQVVLIDNAATSPQTVTLSGYGATGTTASAIMLSASASEIAVHQSVTLSAAITPINAGAPTGTVNFYSGSVLLGSVTPMASGAATLALTSLASGANSITATYSGDAHYTASTSSAVSVYVSPQDIWVVNANGVVNVLDNGGAPVNSGLSGGGASLAIDNAGDVWSAQPAGNSLAEFSSAGVLLGTYTGGGLSSPAALAVSGAGYVWVANGNGTVSAFTNAGVAVSPATGLSGGGLSTPSSIAIDGSGNLWVANSGNNSVTEFLGATDPVVTPLATAAANGTLGSKP